MIDQIGGDFLQWLRGFYYVAKRGSVTQAGMEMGRNQPTISHQIKCLEKEFGVALFERSSGKMELTPEGKALLEKTISLFETVKEMKSEIQGEKLEQEGRVIIATTHAIIHFLPACRGIQKDPSSVDFDTGGGLEMISKESSPRRRFRDSQLPEVPELSCMTTFETSLKPIAPRKIFRPQRLTLDSLQEFPLRFSVKHPDPLWRIDSWRIRTSMSSGPQ
jgi:molybdenum-dependent DNA-binding transcriptional regulator ModE